MSIQDVSFVWAEPMFRTSNVTSACRPLCFLSFKRSTRDTSSTLAGFAGSQYRLRGAGGRPSTNSMLLRFPLALIDFGALSLSSNVPTNAA